MTMFIKLENCNVIKFLREILVHCTKCFEYRYLILNVIQLVLICMLHFQHKFKIVISRKLNHHLNFVILSRIFYFTCNSSNPYISQNLYSGSHKSTKIRLGCLADKPQ